MICFSCLVHCLSLLTLQALRTPENLKVYEVGTVNST